MLASDTEKAAFLIHFPGCIACVGDEVNGFCAEILPAGNELAQHRPAAAIPARRRNPLVSTHCHTKRNRKFLRFVLRASKAYAESRRQDKPAPGGKSDAG